MRGSFADGRTRQAANGGDGEGWVYPASCDRLRSEEIVRITVISWAIERKKRRS